MSSASTAQHTKQYTAIALIAMLVLALSAYGYFLQQTVNTVVERKQTNQQITQLRSQIGDAEAAFGTEIGAATMEKAKELGFTRTDNRRYMVRQPMDSTFVTVNVTSQQ